MDGYVLVAVVVVVIVILHSFNRFKIENCLRPQPLSVCSAIQLYRRARGLLLLSLFIIEIFRSQRMRSKNLRVYWEKNILWKLLYSSGLTPFLSSHYSVFPQRVFWVAISSLHTHGTFTHTTATTTTHICIAIFIFRGVRIANMGVLGQSLTPLFNKVCLIVWCEVFDLEINS